MCTRGGQKSISYLSFEFLGNHLGRITSRGTNERNMAYICNKIQKKYDERIRKDKPLVATALNKPFATRSISSSIWDSDDKGELRMVYVDKGIEGV